MGGRSQKEIAELLVLKRELEWLLREEVHPVLNHIHETLQECYNSLPFHGTQEKSTGTTDSSPHRILMTNPNGSSLHFKSVVTLRGDCVEAADIQFKHKRGKEHHIFKAKLKQGSFWKLPQITDAGNHLCRAIGVASRNDEQHRYKSAKEVFLILDELMESLMKCRHCLSMPKKKTIHDLVENQSMQIFQPPLPSDVAVSFYIHTSRLVLALYFMQHNSQRGDKPEITNRAQVDATVRWLNEANIFFSISLQQCQQLKDKLMAVTQILDAEL